MPDAPPASTLAPPAPRWKLLILALFALGSLALLPFLPAIGQDPAYHRFADRRSLLGIPHFLNVVSNLPFLAVGAWGLVVARRCARNPSRPAWLTLFAGITLVGFGSAWYHLEPNDQTLIWDRLPMTVGFMGLLTALLAEYLDLRRVLPLLATTVLVGVASVVWWRISGDLRLYGWVQFMPLGVIVLLLVLFRPAPVPASWLALALACYALAKAFEHFDPELFALTGNTVSGHSLKHLAAAAGALVLARTLRESERAQT